MSLNFPSRFLKKLNIYQQIRKGQGISRYKKLWKYEAAFLQYSYEGHHQHLSSCINRSEFEKWIISVTPLEDRKELNFIIANLVWKGYIDAVECKDENGEMIGGKILNINKEAHSGNKFGKKGIEYRATMEGLLIGEVLSEINNKNCLLKLLNKYKYGFFLDILWLIPLWILVSYAFGGGWLDSFSGYKPWIILSFVFIGWPLILHILRKIYKYIDNYKNG